MTTYTNGRITLGMDLIFGLVILTEDEWVPFKDLDSEDKAIVRTATDHSNIFPQKMLDIVYGLDVDPKPPS
jgi:hypothetical protein